MPTSSAEADAPRVLAVHPACAVWPANILRVHVMFDRPMDRDRALEQVRIETAAGARVDGALVDMPDGLWTPDQRVLTVLFHPARVKRGLGANARRGRALEPGRDYALVVDSAMADAEGRRLGRDRRTPFRAGTAMDMAVDTARWRMAQPRAGSTEPLTIETDRPLDALGAPLGLCFRRPDGVAVLATFEVAGLAVRATPLLPWPEPPVGLAAAPHLEDACGNRPAEGFERAVSRA